MKKKVLHIVHENALGGGIGTIVDYLNEGINKEKDFSSDTLITNYEVRKNGKDESGNQKYLSRPKDSKLNIHGEKGGVKESTLIKHENLENILGKYDLIHVHGIPHYGILEHLESLKNKKGPKIVNTAHSSVKQEFLAQYENSKRENKKEETESLKYLLENNILNDPSKFGENFWGSAIYRQEKIMTLADSIQHMNESYMNSIINEYMAEENRDKHHVIPNGVKLFRSKIKERPKKKRILFVGRFSKEKGIDELIDSIPYILEKNPDAEIRLVGGDKEGKVVEEYKQKLRYKINKFIKKNPEKNLEEMLDKVKFMGWISDKNEIKKHYEWADYVLIPSYAESFSLSASEALLHGRIPIMTATPALKDLYIDKGIGLGIEPEKRDGKGIGETINKILEKDKTNEYDELIKKGNEYVKENYSYEKMIKNQIDAYKKILDKKSND